MKFREFHEAREKSITFIDIDETLFSTHAQIHVLRDGKILKKLHNTAFNTYELGDGESFDFVEFTDSELFSRTSDPIPAMIEKTKAMFKNIKAQGSDMFLLTARSDFDDKKKFLEFLRSWGLDVGHFRDGKIHVIRAGNTPGKSAATKKKIVGEYLATGKYQKTRLYDDAVSNLDAFLELGEEYPGVQFEAYIIQHGKVRRYT